MPVEYKTENGLTLGKWVRRQQYAYQHPEKSGATLTLERIQLLEQIGMQWDTQDSWKYRYNLNKGLSCATRQPEDPGKVQNSRRYLAWPLAV